MKARPIFKRERKTLEVGDSLICKENFMGYDKGDKCKIHSFYTSWAGLDCVMMEGGNGITRKDCVKYFTRI